MDYMPLPKSPVPRTEQETLIIYGAIVVSLGIVMALIDTCTTRRDDPAQGEDPNDNTTTRGFWADVRYFLLACVWWTAFLPFGAMVGLLAMVLITAADSHIPHEDERDIEAGLDVVDTSEDSPPPSYSVSPIIVTERAQLISETSPPPSYLGVGAPVI